MSNYGWCCSSTDPGNPVRKTFVECMTEGGYYIRGASGQEVTCPDADTELGCCCSCAYVNSDDYNQIQPYPPTTPYLASGTISQTTRCECNRLGGSWTATVDGNCPTLTNSNWETYCVSVNTDVRTPKSCCHLEFDDVTGFPIGVACKDVCTSVDCSLLSTETYPSVFGQTVRCSIPVTTTNPAIANCATPTNLSFLANAPIYQDFEMGSCYTLVDNAGTYEYNCELKPKVICDGYWVAQQNVENAFCVNDYQPPNPVKSNEIYSPASMSLEDFTALGLTSGDEYQGGTFIGIFKPAPLNGTSSNVYGNINFDTPVVGPFNADSVGGTSSKWAIIVDTTAYPVPFLVGGEIDSDYSTSMWDGYYNIYGNGSNFDGIKTALTNTIKYVPRNGFLDYYLPSIYELQFYANYLYSNNIKTIGNVISSSIFNTKYLNKNVSRTRINGTSFVYGLGINENYSVNYRTILIEKRNEETALFFRRILLT